MIKYIKMSSHLYVNRELRAMQLYPLVCPEVFQHKFWEPERDNHPVCELGQSVIILSIVTANITPSKLAIHTYNKITITLHLEK